MCGRFTNVLSWEQIVKLYRVTEPGPDAAPNLQPRYNIAPTQYAPVVRPIPGGRQLEMLRWGLAPVWARALKGPPLINARAETLASAPAFRDAFQQRRCLVPADGFYEWVKLNGERTPYRIVMADGGPMTFAGLWEMNRALDIESFAIVTTSANYTLRPLHDRMPAIRCPAEFDRWLDPAAPAAELLMPAPDDALRLFRVSPKVNSTKTDEPSCIKPLTT